MKKLYNSTGLFIRSDPGLGGLRFLLFTVCPIWLGQGEKWQNKQGRHATLWNIEIKVNPTQVSDRMNNPVLVKFPYDDYEAVP